MTTHQPPINYGHLAAVPLLAGLQVEDFNALAPHIETRTYEKGAALFLKGDKGGALLIVIEGMIDLFIYDDDGNRVVLAQVTAGGFFGEVSLFDNSTRTTNAIATQTTQVIVLSQKVMTEFLIKQPSAAIHIINVLSQRLRDTTDLVTAKDRDAFEMLQEEISVWERIADRISNRVGSWPYLTLLITFMIGWIVLNTTNIFGIWDAPPTFGILALIITTLGALELPLILMSQHRQDKFEQIQADLDRQVNIKSELAILEVTRKLDWLQEATLSQAARLDRLENDLEMPK